MTLDFTTDAFEANLPKSGRHIANAEDIKIFTSQNDISYMLITWRLNGGQAVEHMTSIDAPANHPQYGKTADGKRVVQRLCELAGITPKFNDYEDIIAAFTGLGAEITIAHTIKQGMRVPAVRAIRQVPVGGSPPEPEPEKPAKKQLAKQ